VIASLQNAAVKRLASLKAPKGRREHGAFLVEGPKLVLEALRSDLEVRTIAAEPGALGGALARAVAASGARVVEVSPRCMEKIAEARQPQGIVAEVAAPAVAGRVGEAAGVLLGAVGIRDPGNVGSLLRIVEGAGLDGLAILAGCADPFSPKAVRASAGSIFRARLIRTGWDEILREAGLSGLRIIGTSARDGEDYRGFDYSPPAAILLGGEGEGLSGEMLREADGVIRIPLAGNLESLNVAAAGALIAFEAKRAPRPRP